MKGVVVRTKSKRRGDQRFGVLINGKTDPVAVRPENLRPIYRATFGPPGRRDKPRERGESSGVGSAYVVVFEPHGVATKGARYESSEVGDVKSAGEVEKNADSCSQDDESKAACDEGSADERELQRQEKMKVWMKRLELSYPEIERTKRLELVCTCRE